MKYRCIKKRGNWKNVSTCKECKEILTRNEMMNSNGICPYCGNVTKGTMVLAVKSARRKVVVRCYPWWQIWKSSNVYWEYL